MSVLPGTGGNVELIPRTSACVPVQSARLMDYVRLCRPRIAVMTGVSVMAGFVLASTTVVDWVVAVASLAGISCFVAASSVLNQTLERRTDARMSRTADRGLVTGLVTPAEGWMLGIGLAICGSCVLLALVNVVTALASLATMLVYVFLYTPAKSRTLLCTTIGAVPGAMPPVLGWLACRGTAGVEALALFALFFVWQFPHFLAIGWLHRRDYQRAGLRMLPSFTDQGRRAGLVAVVYAAAFIPVCCLPRFTGMAGAGYLAAALTLSFGYLALSLSFAMRRTDIRARRLLWASLVCLPCLLLCLVADFIRLTS